MYTAHKFSIITAIGLLSLILPISTTSCSPTQSPAVNPAIQNNKPPVIEQLNGPTEWIPLTEGQFECVAKDPDGDSLTYSWTADNGTLVGNGNIAMWTSPANMGKYAVTVTVSDGKGGQVSLAKDVKVILNADGSQTLDAPIQLKMTLPSQEIVSASKRLRSWTPVPVECVIDGSNVKDLKYTWTSSDGKLQGKGLKEGTARQVVWIAPGTGGDYTVNVVVTDQHGNEAKGVVNFKVFCCGNY